MQKYFLKSCEGFLRAALTVHEQCTAILALSEKLSKWHFLIRFENVFDYHNM